MKTEFSLTVFQKPNGLSTVSHHQSQDLKRIGHFSLRKSLVGPLCENRVVQAEVVALAAPGVGVMGVGQGQSATTLCSRVVAEAAAGVVGVGRQGQSAATVCSKEPVSVVVDGEVADEEPASMRFQGQAALTRFQGQADSARFQGQAAPARSSKDSDAVAVGERPSVEEPVEVGQGQ